jgi:FHA domain
VSRNGSFVNGERVRGRRLLRDGDILRFGQSLILYRAPGDASRESTVVSADLLEAGRVSPAQKRVLVALCRPYKDAAAFATPTTNGQIGEQLHLSVDAVKSHCAPCSRSSASATRPRTRSASPSSSAPCRQESSPSATSRADQSVPRYSGSR